VGKGNRDELVALSALAVRAAVAGGQVILDGLTRPMALGWKSSTVDPVTDVDRKGEAQIMRLLNAERPDDGILAEESPERPSASGLRWVVDALDGSVNHLYRIPHCAVSIAVEEHRDHEWTAIVGVVHDPIRAETFSAVRGGGALLGTTALRINEPVPLSQALVATEFSYTVESRRRQVEYVRRVLSAARDIRCTGSSALDLCWTAAGPIRRVLRGRTATVGLVGRKTGRAGGRRGHRGHGLWRPGAGPTLHRELTALLEQVHASPATHEVSHGILRRSATEAG